MTTTCSLSTTKLRRGPFRAVPIPMLTVAMATASVLAACGRSSSKTHSSAPASSAVAAGPRTPFVATADRVCADQDRQEKALGSGLVNADIVPADRLPKAADYLDKIVAIKEQGLPQLDQLAAAAGTDQPARQAFVTAFRQVVDDYRHAATAAHNGDAVGFRSAFDRVAPHGKPDGPDAEALARAAAPFPFGACGKGSEL